MPVIGVVTDPSSSNLLKSDILNSNLYQAGRTPTAARGTDAGGLEVSHGQMTRDNFASNFAFEARHIRRGTHYGRAAMVGSTINRDYFPELFPDADARLYPDYAERAIPLPGAAAVYDNPTTVACVRIRWKVCFVCAPFPAATTGDNSRDEPNEHTLGGWMGLFVNGSPILQVGTRYRVGRSSTIDPAFDPQVTYSADPRFPDFQVYQGALTLDFAAFQHNTGWYFTPSKNPLAPGRHNVSVRQILERPQLRVKLCQLTVVPCL